MTRTFEQLRPAYSRVADYFGFWAMQDEAFSGLFSLITDMNLIDHVERRTLIDSVPVEKSKIDLLVADYLADSGEEASDGPPYQVTPDGIAIFQVSGTMMKAVSSFSSSRSTVQLRNAMRMAGRDPAIRGAITVFDTPGGTVAGTAELADDWAALGKKMPTASHIDDLCCSAGIWVASQGGMVSANRTAVVGSIGTYTVVMDTSGRAEQMKVKVHVIRAGAHKGAGYPGTAVTDEHLAAAQQRINDMNEQFLKGVSSGRKMDLEKVRSIADGNAHVGEVAKTLGLVDAIQSFDETYRQLVERAGRQKVSQKGTSKMTEQTTTAAAGSQAAPLELKSTAATLGELRAHLKGADSDFLLKQLEGNVTLSQAQSNWIAEQNDRLEKSKKELEDAKSASGKHPGTKGLGEGKPSSEDDHKGDAIQSFSDLVRKFQVEDKLSYQKAVAAAARKNPELHQSFLMQTNPNKKSRRLLEEKYANDE